MIEEKNNSIQSGHANIAMNAAKYAARVTAYALAFDTIHDKIMSAVGKGKGRTFDGSFKHNQEKLEGVNVISREVEGRFVALPQHIIDELRKDNPDKGDKISNLDELWKEKFKEIDEAIAKKILEEREEEERRIQKKQSEQVLMVAGSVNKNIEDEKSENADSLKYRIFASLIFSGILDVTDILGCVLDIFGVNDDFAKAVGNVVADDNVMSFFGKINHAFGIDKALEGISKFPIINDINQSALEMTKTDAFQTFSPLAKEAITGDLAESAMRFASVVQMVIGERGLQINHEERSRENDEKIRDLEETIREGAKPDVIRIATRVIEVETRFKLDESYMRNYLQSVCGGYEEISDVDRDKLGHFKIRDGDKNDCGTLFDKINEVKQEGDEAEKISKIQKILELVVEDKARNNMQVLESFGEVARKSFYESKESNQFYLIIVKEREEYLKGVVLNGLGDAGNEYKKEAAQEALKEAIQAKYAGNPSNIGKKNSAISALSNPDDFADFIKNEFQGRKEFDDIVTKIAISVRKDEVASSIVRSPFHRVRPETVISGGDTVGGGIRATNTATGGAVGAATTDTTARTAVSL